MSRRIPIFQTIISGGLSVDNSTVATAIDVRDYRNCVISLAAVGGADLKVFFKGAVGEVAPAFGSPRSKANQWDYIDVADLEDGASIDGDTGLTFNSGNAYDNTRLVEININALDFLAIHQTQIVTGAADALIVFGTFTTNE